MVRLDLTNSIPTCCLGKILTEPTYFERDLYDLPPLVRVNSQLMATEATLADLPSDSTSTQQRLIFAALTQVLTPLGVRFKFSIQRHPQTQVSTASGEHTILQSPAAAVSVLEYRLRVRCYSPKSFDCQVLAEPLAKKLRSIDLEDFEDAIIQFSRFSGKDRSAKTQIADWRLQIDLTPPTVRLKSWARWGDVQSITKLLNFALAPQAIQVSATLKNLTLQIFCTHTNPQSVKSPAKKIVLDRIAPLLIAITPQGIQGATIHGVQSQSVRAGQIGDSPDWIHWLDLPALGDPRFSPTPIILAARGDREALNFILERLLNPDLEQCFAIGGISLSLLRRHHLLHVMSEAPICPIQSQVATTIVKVLKQLDLPGIRGVRVHGRISGQSTANWSYGVDFHQQPLELPPVDPSQQFVVEPSIAKISLQQRIYDRLVATRIWKPQLVMSNNSQLVFHPRFQWQPSLLLLLVGLGLAIGIDFTIRLAIESRQSTTSSPTAPVELSFNNAVLEEKLAQYQQRCLQQGVPDVLIVGSSRALRGIDPEILRRNLAPDQPNLKVYNFGINGATAQVVDLILRQLLTSEQLPKIVIWGDGARAFNSARTDRTYETIAQSDRYRQLSLMSGIKNSNSSLLQAQSSFQNTYQAIDTGLDLELAKVSSAYHQRDRLKSWLRNRVPFVMQITDSSSDSSSLDPSASINEQDIDVNGFLPLPLQFDPTTYYQRYTKVSGNSDSDYANFQLSGMQERAFHQTIDLLASRKIPLVFVNMPLSDLYLDQFRQQHDLAFKQYMQKLMDTDQLTFVDLDGLLNHRYDQFSDPSHLNQFGASEVSKYLAQVRTIPWLSITNR
jgi:Protein of unknown function (DUF1574)